METKKVFIVGSSRIAFFKSMTEYAHLTTNELLLGSLESLVTKMNLQGKILGDVACGALMNGSRNWGMTREVIQSTGLSPLTPGYNVQRACGTSLDTTMQIAAKIALGQINSGIAGGVDTNSDLPMMLSRSLTQKLLALNNAKSTGEKMKIALSMRLGDFKPQLPAVVEPRTGLSMGEHCEKMVKEFGVSRQEQDQIAFESHQKAAKAYEEGFYSDLISEFHGKKVDGILRKDTSLERLAKLKPAFDKSTTGSLTAGNSTPLTDGSAAVLLADEVSAKKNGWPLLAQFVDAQVAAVDYAHGEGLLMAPTVAVSELLQRNNLKLQDFDFYEIHEAFAGQVNCTLKAWESDDYCKKRLGRDKALGPIDRKKMNVKGGSLAVGHPFAATGARIVGALAKIISQAPGGNKRGLISICTAGGMGVTAILQTATT